MSRDTSAKAYNHIVSTGILGKRKTQVYEVLYPKGPLGPREVWEEIIKRPGCGDIPQHSIGPRFKQMERDGVIKLVGEHKCPYTGRMVDTWDVTSKIPLTKSKTKRSKGARLRRYVKYLTDKHGDDPVAYDEAMRKILKAMDRVGL